ncbi:hypothetical protein D9M69_644620 [compost metagenome]
MASRSEPLGHFAGVFSNTSEFGSEIYSVDEEFQGSEFCRTVMIGVYVGVPKLEAGTGMIACYVTSNIIKY